MVTSQLYWAFVEGDYICCVRVGNRDRRFLCASSQGWWSILWCARRCRGRDEPPHCLPPLQSPKPVHPTAPPDIHPSVKAIKTQITSSTDSPHSHAVLLAALHPHTLIAPRPTPFSIVWLSDTQTMSYQRYPGRLAELGKWIDGERAKRGIAYVVQDGRRGRKTGSQTGSGKSLTPATTSLKTICLFSRSRAITN